MDSDFKLFWTEEATRNLESILDYLSDKWTENELVNFKNILSRQIRLIGKFPLIFPASTYNPRLRKAVLSKQTIIFYEVKDHFIYIVFLFNTMQNPEKVK
ncbi:MAG TPA: type II toxin-antitoxin system RelE/ParE family toxin [Prolixibacteraceae bacterium]|nr:type II toxin-antitoxin system RelE/ParE family toxin [Prolixibacteraceae bacterium]